MTENKAGELPDQRVFPPYVIGPGPSLKMRTRRVSFTWNHFLRPVHSLGLRLIGLFKARYQMRSSTSTARTLHTRRSGWPKGSINWDFSLSLSSHWILLIPLWNRNNNNKKMAHAGASINAAPLVVSPNVEGEAAWEFQLIRVPHFCMLDGEIFSWFPTATLLYL